MYRVVVGIAPDHKQVLDEAAAVADLPGDRAVHVTLVHVIEEGKEDAESVPAVGRACEFLVDQDIRTDMVIDAGSPTDVLLAVADERDADLLCVAGRPPANFSNALAPRRSS